MSTINITVISDIKKFLNKNQTTTTPQSDIDLCKTLNKKYKFPLYTLIWASKYNNITVTPFKVNSANCSFSYVTTNQTDLFVKFVNSLVGGNTDSILLDNLNGIALSELNKQKNIFMDYVDSFKTYVPYKALNWNFMSVTNFTMTIPVDRKKIDYKHVSIFKKLEGISIAEILANNSAYEDDPSFHIEIITAVSEFVKDYEDLAKTHGIIHNDMHLGNIFCTVEGYDVNEKCKIVLIDYGRMYISEDNTSNYNKHLENEAIKNHVEITGDGSRLVSKLHKYMKSFKIDGTHYYGYIFDIITLGCNMYEYYLHTHSGKEKVQSELIKFRNLGNENLQITFLYDLFEDAPDFKTFKTTLQPIFGNPESPVLPEFDFIIRALYYLLLLLYFYTDICIEKYNTIPRISEDKGSNKLEITYEFNIDDLPVYRYFQFVRSQKYAEQFIEVYKSLINTAQSNELSGAGAGALPRQVSRPGSAVKTQGLLLRGLATSVIKTPLIVEGKPLVRSIQVRPLQEETQFERNTRKLAIAKIREKSKLSDVQLATWITLCDKMRVPSFMNATEDAFFDDLLQKNSNTELQALDQDNKLRILLHYNALQTLKEIKTVASITNSTEQQGGSSKYTKTDKKVTTPKGKRTVYKGPRGKEYIKYNKEYTLLSKVVKAKTN